MIATNRNELQSAFDFQDELSLTVLPGIGFIGLRFYRLLKNIGGAGGIIPDSEKEARIMETISNPAGALTCI